MTRPLMIGIGCKRGVSADAVVSLVQTALSRVEGKPTALFTIADKVDELALSIAAALLGLPLVYLPRQDLAATADKTETRSDRVVALFGVPSVAETAALAGAGGSAELLLPRISENGVTVAIASPEETS